MLIAKKGDQVIVILQPENLARMKQGDPVTIEQLNLVLCYEDISTEQLVEKCKVNPMSYLCRGWQEHPDDYTEPQRIL